MSVATTTTCLVLMAGLSLNLADSTEDFSACVERSLVVSEVFCLPADYKKDIPPPMAGPIQVFLKLPVSEVSNIDDQRSQISLRITYKIQWPEPRMILNDSADWSQGDINVRGDMVNHFWTPDIIIHDLVSFYKPEVLNQVAAFEIKKNKKLYYKVRSDLTMVCTGMKFARFPLDEHICYLQLTSFGYNDQEMMLDGEFSYESENQRALPFNVVITEIDREKRTYIGANSNYSVYGLEIRLSRCVSPYLLNVYLPTAIFVVMSWVSFLIPTDVVPARIVLLVTLCLVIINTFNNVTARIPVASQVTALEVWLLACILLVFGALAEYAFILRQIIVLNRRARKTDAQLRSCAQSASPAGMSTGMSYRVGTARDSNPQLQHMLQQQMQQMQSPINMFIDDDDEDDANTIDADDKSCPRRRQQTQQHNGGNDWDAVGVAMTTLGGSGSGNGANGREDVLLLHGGGGGGRHHHHHEEARVARMPAQPHRRVTHALGAQQQNRSESMQIGSATPPVSLGFGSAVSAGRRAPLPIHLPGSGSGGHPAGTHTPKKTTEQLMRKYQEHVDGNALILFPVSFLLFNVGYWCHYLVYLNFF